MLQRIARIVAETVGRETRLIRQLRPAYESLLDRVSGGRGIEWEINGATYRIDPRYRHCMAHDYDAPTARFLRERVRPGAVCFNAGANIGVYVLQFARWSGPTGRVVAFEPNPAAAEVLVRHVCLNHLEDVVTIETVAIGVAEGSATLYRAGADGMSRLGEPNELIADRAVPITVPVTTLDGFCARSGLVPDWLLMDIEGFEIAALRGAMSLIGRQRGKIGIVVEMHPSVWESAGTARDAAEQFLSESGLRAVPLAGQRNPLREHGLVHLSWS